MLGRIIRAGLLGLMTSLLFGSLAATPALAEGGPYCHHREIGAKGEGERIAAQTPEGFTGSGGAQVLSGKVLGMTIHNVATSAQVKGILYNNADQCQAKVEIQYHEISVEGNPGCIVTVNRDNIVKLYGHRVWKWNGTKAQLEEKKQESQFPDWLFLPAELAQGAKEVPKGVYAEVEYATKTGEKCFLSGNKLAVKGSTGAETEPAQAGTWGTVEKQLISKGVALQHFWNGTEFIGLKTGLEFGENAEYKGQFTIETTGYQGRPKQEVAYFEN